MLPTPRCSRSNFATEEPPLAGWEDTTLAQYRKLAVLAADLVK